LTQIKIYENPGNQWFLLSDKSAELKIDRSLLFAYPHYPLQNPKLSPIQNTEKQLIVFNYWITNQIYNAESDERC